MGNDNAAMADFAQSLWENYIKQKWEENNINGVSFYRAKVVANNHDGTLTVQRPFDNAITVNCTSGMRGLSANDQVVVAKLGNSTAAMNHLVFAKADGDLYSNDTLASGTYKHVTANTWEYTGIYFTMTNGSFIYLTSSVDSGRATGLGLATNPTESFPRSICYEAEEARRTPIYYLPSGTYYLYEKRNAAATSNNTLRVLRIWI